VKGSGSEYAFLLNQCPPAQQSARVELSAKALQALGVLLSPLVSSRVDYQEASRLGLGVSEYNPEGVAAQEMKELWHSIRRRLRRAPTKPAAKPAARIPAAATKAKIDAVKKAARKAA